MVQSTPQPPPSQPRPSYESDADRAARAHREEAQAKAQADEMTAQLPVPGSPIPGALSPEQAAGDGPTVSMTFPRDVMLTTDEYQRIHFPAGVQKVPKDYADHEWLKANGVKAGGEQQRA